MDWVSIAESIPMRGFIDLKTTVKDFLVDAERYYEQARVRVERFEEKVKEAEALHRTALGHLDNLRDAPQISRTEGFLEKLQEAEKEVEILSKSLLSITDQAKYASHTKDSAEHHIKVMRAAKQELGDS